MTRKQLEEHIISASGRAVRWEDWKRALTVLLVMTVLCVVLYYFHVPNPNMILITGLVVFTSLFGLCSGMICAGVMLLYSMFFFSTDHNFVSYTDVNLQKLVTVLLGVVLNTIFVGRLKREHQKTVAELTEVNRILTEDNEVLKEASMQDGLTGLRNRFALRRDFRRYEQQPIFVMMVDVDDFKSINDTHGHEMGDLVLRTMADALQEQFGPENCYRYGGDEFLVLWPGAYRQVFDTLAGRFLRRMERESFGDPPFSVGVSGGYVYGAAEMNVDLQTMIRHADMNLYEAKRKGKNRIAGGRFRLTLSEQLAAN